MTIDYGWVDLRPRDDVIAGSYGSWTVALTVGVHGIDDGGRVLITRRMVSDWGRPQFEAPAGPEYTTVHTSGAARLRARYDPKAYVRPWEPAIVIDVYDGALAPGDTVTVALGDTSAGSPGSRAQTFAETRCEFRVVVDAFGTGQFVPIPGPSWVRVVGGPAVRLRTIVPSDRLADQPIWVLVRAEDRYGNLSPDYRGCVEIIGPGGEELVSHTFSQDDHGCYRFESLKLPMSEGVSRLTALDQAAGFSAISNPFICHEVQPQKCIFWGDLHGQTQETVGTGTLDEYFTWGRNAAGLDFISHQGNDFQITREFWVDLRAKVQEYHEPGRFVTFLGYEWSGNTPAGGDHNVIFLHDDQPLHRSSHWQIDDCTDVDSDRYPITKLYETFQSRDDVLLIPHVGGRRANLSFHEPELERLIEIYSVHGCFEWFLEEALRRGYRVGFIASSDDHTCRPGAAFPSSSDIHFGVRGGLTAVYATQLTREALWEALRSRRCYATTGERILLSVTADGRPMGAEYATNRLPSLSVRVVGTAPLRSVELRRGLETIHQVPSAIAGTGSRIELIWTGARSKDRHRRTDWDGSLTLSQGEILHVHPFAFDSPDEGITEVARRQVSWRSSTVGDPDGLILDLRAPPDTELTFTAAPTTFSFTLGSLQDASSHVVQAGGVGQQVLVRCVSERPGPAELGFEYTDDEIKPGVNPYYVRVVQSDGAMAWSSPIYVRWMPYRRY